jgi:hypothetical protein
MAPNPASHYSSHPTTPRSRATVGDVLILWTSETYTIYAVGRVRRTGQCDFQGQDNVKHLTSWTTAIEAARTIARARGRIHIVNIDTGRWSEIGAAARRSSDCARTLPVGLARLRRYRRGNRT